jgi:hypothetical protein
MIVSEACTINISLAQALGLAVPPITILSDAPSCGISYSHHSDDSRGVIYKDKMFIKQAEE